MFETNVAWNHLFRLIQFYSDIFTMPLIAIQGVAQRWYHILLLRDGTEISYSIISRTLNQEYQNVPIRAKRNIFHPRRPRPLSPGTHNRNRKIKRKPRMRWKKLKKFWSLWFFLYYPQFSIFRRLWFFFSNLFQNC